MVETIDQLIWAAYLQEAAKRRGLSWPHQDCKSSDLGTRLPCEMLVEGINEHLKEVRTPIFNANRLDMIWPEDFAGFRRGLWNKGDQRLSGRAALRRDSVDRPADRSIRRAARAGLHRADAVPCRRQQHAPVGAALSGARAQGSGLKASFHSPHQIVRDDEVLVRIVFGRLAFFGVQLHDCALVALTDTLGDFRQHQVVLAFAAGNHDRAGHQLFT